MTKQQKKDAIEYIMGQLDCGYIDLGSLDKDALEVVQEAMTLLRRKEIEKEQERLAEWLNEL